MGLFGLSTDLPLLFLMISQSSIDEIKSKSILLEVIQDFVKLKHKGATWEGLCPFHSERTPSFKVNPAKDIYKCFGCGKSGDAINFLMDHENTGYIGALEYLANKYNIQIERGSAAKQYEIPPPRLEKLPKETIEYFEKRGISNNTLLRFDITQTTEWLPKAGKEVSAICFNYYKEGQLVNIKFRGKDKDFKMVKNAELCFYNLDAIKDENTAIIVEGEVDCLSLREAGIHNVVSVPNGATMGSASLDYLNSCWSYFEDKEQVVIMTDNDEPGRNLREELARRIGKEKCLKVEMPPDCKDANDILKKHGKERLNQVVVSAAPWPLDGIIPVSEMYTSIMDYYYNGYPGGVEAKIGEFDEYLTFMPGQLTIVTGIPGHGKSEFTDYLMTQLARVHDWGWGIFSFENQPSSFHATKIIEKFAGLSFAKRINPYHRMTVEQLEEAITITDRFFHFANINTVDISVDGILKKAKELVNKKGIKGLLIDPWNYIEHQVPAGYTETQYISECLTELKIFSVKYGVHIFLVAHPTKMQKDKSGKKFEVPTPYSISGSAHFFNKADNAITVYRDYELNLVNVYVQKVRHSWLGKTGCTSFHYDTFIRQYKSL